MQSVYYRGYRRINRVLHQPAIVRDLVWEYASSEAWILQELGVSIPFLKPGKSIHQGPASGTRSDSCTKLESAQSPVRPTVLAVIPQKWWLER